MASRIVRQNVWRGLLFADATPQLKGLKIVSCPPTIPAEEKPRIVLPML